MTRDVQVCGPADSIRACAAAMSKNDVGALPVAENSLLIGMVTDRDITVRAVAAGKGPDTPVREVLTPQILFCFEDQDLAHIADAMGKAKVHRIPVLSKERRLVGMLSLSDVAARSPEVAGAAIVRVSEPGGPHTR